MVIYFDSMENGYSLVQGSKVDTNMSYFSKSKPFKYSLIL